MNDSPQSTGERHIDRIMRELEPGSERYRVLDTAKRFKSSWVELGDKLLKVSSSGLFREWGYDSFEDYCSQEIRIKKGTAEKLTMAYRFMERHEPEILVKREDLKPLPDYRSLDLLRRAREEKGFTEAEYGELRKSVVEEQRSHPTVLKRFNEVVAAKEDGQNDPRIIIKTGLAAARRLNTSLQALTAVPDGCVENLRCLIAHLEAELDALSAGEPDR